MSESTKVIKLLKDCNEIFKGKEDKVKLAFIALLSRGHILIEDIPGVGKTTLAHLLSKTFGMNMSRIQFTNDLLPTDIIGTSIFDKTTSEFIFKRGPIFSQMILADELNRASPKTQSALLQAMEERHISFDGCEYQLDSPFVVIATQNSLNSIGTNPLPESQLDRFMMSFSIGLPDIKSEKQIILNGGLREDIKELTPKLDSKELSDFFKLVSEVHVEEHLLDYLLNFLTHLRENLNSARSLSVRVGQDLYIAMKACAFMEGREFATHDDFNFIAPFIISHRLNSVDGLEKKRNDILSALSDFPIR